MENCETKSENQKTNMLGVHPKFIFRHCAADRGGSSDPKNRTNTRSLRHRDEPSGDVTKLTCRCTPGGHASNTCARRFRRLFPSYIEVELKCEKLRRILGRVFPPLVEPSRRRRRVRGEEPAHRCVRFTSWSDGCVRVVKLAVGKGRRNASCVPACCLRTVEGKSWVCVLNTLRRSASGPQQRPEFVSATRETAAAAGTRGVPASGFGQCYQQAVVMLLTSVVVNANF